MAKLKTYPDLFTHRRRSVLPEEAQRAIRELDGGGGSIPDQTRRIDAYRAALSALEPDIVAQASVEIREIGGLYQRNRPGVLRRLLPGQPARQADGSGWFIQFHGNGFEREAAIRHLNDAPRSPFEFVAIVYRMNDWAIQVRNAAFDYAERHFPHVEPDIVGKAAFFLFRQARLLSRWEPRAAKLVEDTLYDERVLPFIKDRLLHAAEGPVVRVLRAAMKRPDLDPFLPELALGAKSAAVRACAAEVLLNGRAQWADGYKRVWVDKVYGISRREPDLQRRPLSVSADIREHLEAASKDKSAQVRRIAASVLIGQLDNPQYWHAEIATKLKDDKNPGVASRMEFYFRKLASAGAQRRISPPPANDS